jgi:hypothetical protein
MWRRRGRCRFRFVLHRRKPDEEDEQTQTTFPEYRQVFLSEINTQFEIAVRFRCKKSTDI